ncbi:unnamed protein product, partial [Rotaria magnacalcarata]
MDSTVIDSQYEREHEEGAGETDIVHEEILQKPSATEIELESPHESDHEEDEAVQYQLQQNLTSDQIAIESSHIAEDEEHELSSSFEVGTIHSHQIIERRPNIEQDMVESSATIEPQPDEEQYEQNYESDQHAPEYRTAGEVTKTESATQDDEKPFEESVTPQQEFVESPLQATPSADEQDDYSHSRETSADDTSIIEPSAKGEEYGHQLSFENEETDELHVAHEFEILQKSSDIEIQLESAHESDHEKENQYHPESVVSSDAIKIEPTETVEHHRYEPIVVSQQQQNIGYPVIERQYEREDEQGAGQTYIVDEEFLQKPSATEIRLESAHESDHEEEDQYHLESVVTSDAIKIEHTETVEHEQYEPMLLSQQQQQLGSPVLEGQYEREEVERAGETHIVHEEIQPNVISTEIESESLHESYHEEDAELQHQPEQKLKSDEITIESPRITERDQHELCSSFEAGTIPSHQISERRLSTGQVLVESSAGSEAEQDEDQYDAEEKIYVATHLIESSVADQEDKEQVEEEPFVLESHAGEKYEIGRSAVSQHIHIESPDENEHEEAKQQEQQLPSDLEHATGVEQDRYIPTLSLEQVLIDYRDATLGDNEAEKAIHEAEEVLHTKSFIPLCLQQSEQYQGVRESITSSPQIKLEYAEEYDGQEQLERQQETNEIPMSDEYEINRKSSDAEIQLESPHEIDHVEKVEHHSPVHEHTTTQFVAESAEEVEQDEYKPTLSIEHILNQYNQVIESEARGLVQIDDMERMLESVHHLTVCSQLSDEKQNKEEEESKTST